MLYFEHHYKFRTMLYSLETKNYTKLWVHGNWGRTETGDTTVPVNYTVFGKHQMHLLRLQSGSISSVTITMHVLY